MARHSLAARASLAILLMVGFYVLALGVVCLLFYLPYAEWRHLHFVDFRVGGLALVGGIAILSSLWPRADRFADPGPRLTDASHPALFATIRSIAEATRQSPLVDVFLIPGVNAWVAQRGGTMGLGGRRVMGLGLPLMGVLSVSEMEAVLAHEFGHFDAGDAALGPWLYKTRAAIGRTLVKLNAQSKFLSLPFIWYGKGFLRLTNAVSRHQEFAADNLAARAVSPAVLRRGLETIHRVAPAFSVYWVTEVMPILAVGFRPPLAEGFRRFLAAPTVAGEVDALQAKTLAGGATDPYDSHPPLNERVAALAELPDVSTAMQSVTAISLLGGIDPLELALLPFAVPAAASSSFTPVAWEETAETVWVPHWRALIEGNRAALSGLTPEGCLALVSKPGELVVRIGLVARADRATARHIQEAGYLVLCAFCLALYDAGWSLGTAPGNPMVFQRGAEKFVPRQFLQLVSNRAITMDSARAALDAAGITGRDFGAPTVPAAS